MQAQKNELAVQVRGIDTEANKLRRDREWPDQERKDAVRKLTSLRAVALHRLQVRLFDSLESRCSGVDMCQGYYHAVLFHMILTCVLVHLESKLQEMVIVKFM